MSQARPSRATVLPMEPRPTMPRVLPPRFQPTSSFLAQWPSRSRAIGRAQLAGQGQEQGEGHLGHGPRAGTRDAMQGDAPGLDRGEVQVVEAGSGPDDQAQRRGAVQEGLVDGHAGAEHEGFAVGHARRQLLAGDTDGKVDLMLGLEGGQGAGIDLGGDEDLHAASLSIAVAGSAPAA